MAGITKNFLIKNGLEVNGALLVVNTDNNKVGVGTTVLVHDFNVKGGIGVTNALVTGIATVTELISLYSQTGVTTISTLTATNANFQQINVSGVSTFAGITTVTGTTLFANQVSVSGVSTFAGITTVTGTTLFANQLSVSGVATASQFSGPLSGTVTGTLIGDVNSSGVSTFTTLKVGTGVTINSGIVTATSFSGSGINLTGIVTFLSAGGGISLTNSVGIVTISTTGGGGGGGESYWVQVASGIHTTSSAGIGTTNPTSRLTVSGDAIITGVVTATDFNSTSDARLKTNVHIIEDPIDKIQKINGVSFNWIENQKPSMGVIADELQKVLPELVTDTDPKTVNYNGLIGLLIECIKSQEKRIEELEKNCGIIVQ
jgi:hypothetical protein